MVIPEQGGSPEGGKGVPNVPVQPGHDAADAPVPVRHVRELARGSRVTALIRRIVDRWRHPGETARMRDYRRYRDTTGRDPYTLSSARNVREGGPWMAHPTATINRRMARRVDAPIVGVRVEYGTRKGDD